MASISWTSGTNGAVTPADWNTATFWTPATVPTAADDVVIDAANTAYTVTIAGGETANVHSLTMNDVVGRPGTNDAAGYHAAELVLAGTLAFAPGSAGALDGPLQNYVFTDVGANAAIINGGTLNAFIQVAGNLTLTGINAVYITNEIQALGGTVTIDTPIATMLGTTLFDGIFQAKGLGSVMHLGGAGNPVDIVTIEGPQGNPTGWTELTFADPTSVIDEWNVAAAGYVSVESSLMEISGGGTIDVTFGRNFTTTNTLTIDNLGSSVGAGMLNMQGVTVATSGIDINSGIVQGYGTISSGVVNNGTLIALGGTAGGTLAVTGDLTGTGSVVFDHNAQEGGDDTTKATLVVHGVTAGQTITMNGGDTLELAAPAAFLGKIAAQLGDRIVFDGVTATGATLNNGTLVVTNGAATVASLVLSGTYANEGVSASGSILTFGTSVVPGILPQIPAPVSGISTTTLSSSDLSALLQGNQSAMRFVSGTEAIVLVDGVLSVGPDTNEAFLTRLYESLLGRGPDQNGISAWDAALNAGTSQSAIAQGFVNSPEFQTTHPDQDNNSFVTALYKSFLGRNPEPAGSAAWTALLDAGGSRGDVTVGFANSAEAKQVWSGVTSLGVFAHDPNSAIVREDYIAGLGRDAEAGGLAAWTNLLNNGVTPVQLAQSIAASPEFQALHGAQSDTDYVNSVYQNALGRSAEPAGLAAWTNALQAGGNRGDVMAAIGQSPEAQGHLQWALQA
jgi:hypothetical protein